MARPILKLAILLSVLGIMVACNPTNRSKIKKKMFTAEQIKKAHCKIRSGADFPSYIQEIKALGVTHYEAYVKIIT